MFKPSLEVMQSTSSERNNALPNRLNDVEVSLIRRKKHRAYLMESLSMNPAMSGEECATMLREHYNEHQTRAIRMLKLLARTAITQRLGISIVTVSLMSGLDPEQQGSSQLVAIKDEKPDDLLSRAFRRPDRYREFLDFPMAYLPYGEPNKAVLVNYHFSRGLAGIWLGVIVLISIVAGILTGVLYESVDLGFGIGGGVLASLAAVQTLIIWLVK